MPIDNQFINVSGLPSFEELRVTFPSGEFGVPVSADLAELQATFGFNQNPHRFELQYIPESFDATELPTIGSGVAFSIGDFFIAGRIKHADYSKSTRGKILSVTVEDIRTDLSDIYLDTYGIFGTNDAPSNNIVDIRFWYVQTHVITQSVSRSQAVRDLRLLEENGASYRQIYEAVKYFEEQQGTINDVLSKLPDPDVIAAQLPLDPEGYRFRFKAQPLLDAIAKILNDISYDFYYDMAENKIDVINRKFAVNISENAIPVADDPAPIIMSRYGIDEGERPTTARLYGGEMEGLIGSGRLMTRSGAYGLNSSQYDMGIVVGTPAFVPGWKAKLKYFGPDGFLNEYVPQDREMAMSLKSIEHWAYEVDLDNRIGNFTIDSETGETIEQKSITGSGMGLILNRRQDGRSWIIEWYNRVRTHAQNNFGRTYILSPSSVLYNHIDDIDVMPASWCNLENQTDDGSFADNYKISDQFKFLAPFWDADSNKMRAWALFEDGTKWGIDGEQTPAKFTEWNEDETHQFVPIEARKFDTARKKFKETFLSNLEENEKGIVIRLPAIAWDKNAIEDEQLKIVQRLGAIKQIHDQITSLDIPNPYKIVQPYERLYNIAIPIKVKRRYGFNFPRVWASGAGTALEVIIREDLVPWQYEPRGLKTSVDLMGEEALSALDGRVVNRDTVTFAEATKVGLPIISFDQFANQSQLSQGFGIVSHGITSLTISKNLSWWQTKYNIKSHFPQQIKAKPIQQAIDEDFAFAIKRLEQDLLLKKLPIEFDIPEIHLPTDEGRKSVKSDTGIEHVVERSVTIEQVFGRGSTDGEYYLGVDAQGIKWPRSLDAGFGNTELQRAFGIDGFFQVGMQAVYRLEKRPDGSISQYFKGGIPLSDTRIVKLKEAPRQVDGIFVATVETLDSFTNPVDEAETINITPFEFKNVKFMSQTSVDTTLAADDLVQISMPGNKKELVPGADYGPGQTKENDAFLVNTSVPSQNFPAFVTVKPNSQTGRNGTIQSFDSTGGQTFVDGQETGGQTYNVLFIGVEPDQIETGDFCTVFQFRESDGSAQFRLYCLITKPVFLSNDALGG